MTSREWGRVKHTILHHSWSDPRGTSSQVIGYGLPIKHHNLLMILGSSIFSRVSKWRLIIGFAILYALYWSILRYINIWLIVEVLGMLSWPWAKLSKKSKKHLLFNTACPHAQPTHWMQIQETTRSTLQKWKLRCLEPGKHPGDAVDSESQRGSDEYPWADTPRPAWHAKETSDPCAGWNSGSSWIMLNPRNQ